MRYENIKKNQNLILISLNLHFKFIILFSAYFIIFTSFSGEGGAKNPIPDSGESIMQVYFIISRIHEYKRLFTVIYRVSQ